MNKQRFFTTAALGSEPLLAAELSQLGAEQIEEQRAGVGFSGTLESAYRVCLWSRLASRVLLPLKTVDAETPEQLYAAVLAVDWSVHLSPELTFAVDCSTTRSRIRHSHYAALRVKDAVVDQFRARSGTRPAVATERPDLRLNLHINRDRATLSIDLSGDSLHRRGYRSDGVQAPLKENLAAALLARAQWPEICAAGGALVDPLCGSGSLPLEAALLASDTAPGLLRSYFGFLGWKKHAAAVWDGLVAEARRRREQGLAGKLPPICGYDVDRRAIRAAWQHAQNAGLAGIVHFERRTLREFVPPAGAQTGLLVTNPPYGERLGDEAELPGLYNLLGEKMAGRCRGWKAAVLTANSQLGRSIGLRADKINVLYNGALKCQLLQFELDERNRWQSLDRGAGKAIKKPLSPGAQMFANRLSKNLKKYAKWARREGIDGYRLYDADLPEYAFAVDLYGDEVHLQEYRAPKTIDEKKAAVRRHDVLAAVPQVLGVTDAEIHLKVRQTQKGPNQYRKQDDRGRFKEVREGQCRFLVNLSDYLDTGLFLDHRLIRGLIRDWAAGKRFLNLFAYTGTATVYALLGGARATTTVDMSHTYLGWAEKNIALNGFDPQAQELIQADCLAWVAAVQESRRGAYDLIFLDPPTFSNSKSMSANFDVQRDHVELLCAVASLLAPGGTLIFSNNRRDFKLEPAVHEIFDCEDLSRQTIPYDFERNPRIHNCRRLTLR